MAMSDNDGAAPVKKRKRVTRLERSRLIWEEVEQAMVALAIRRGWPHETQDDLDQAARLLDEENPNPYRRFRAGLGACRLFQDNIKYDFMDMAEVKSTQPIAERFIKELEVL